MYVSETRTPRRRGRLLLRVAVPVAAAAALTAALLPGSGAAVALAPPNNTGEPSIAGKPIVGRTLTARRGSWSGSTPMSFAYRWLRCPSNGGAPDGSNCAPIGGSAGSGTTYRVGDADVGFRLRVRVTATNADGSDSAASNPTGKVRDSEDSGSPPNNTGEPRILGEAVEGRTLTANRGSWSGSTPMSFAYRWLRCPRDGGAPDGSNCAPIGGADDNTYRVRDADVGLRLRVRVTATNSEGSDRAASNPTEIVRGSARPRNMTPPTISGSPVVGQTLTGDPGTWSGTQPITFTYQWRICNASGGNCSAIAGATSRTYVLRQSDVGSSLRFRATARNANGTEIATSAPTGVIVTGAPSGCPGGSGPINVSQVTPPARLLVDRFRVTPNPIPRSVGALTVGFRVTACGGRPVAGALVYVTAVPYNQFAIPPEARTGGDGFAFLRMERLRGFPAATNQTLLVMFVRARKDGEPILAGISTRRLISFRLAK